MAALEWHAAVDLVTPHVVRIWTPQGSGTGFLVSLSKGRNHEAAVCCMDRQGGR